MVDLCLNLSPLPPAKINKQQIEQGVIRKHADQFHKLNEGAAGPMGPMGLGMVPPGMMPMSMPMPMPMPGYGGMKRGREYEDPYGGSKQHRPRGLGGGTTGDVFEVTSWERGRGKGRGLVGIKNMTVTIKL